MICERFEFTRQLGNLFLVRPDILKSFIRDNYLEKIEPQFIMPYLAQRSDWVNYDKSFDKWEGVPDGPESKSFRGRLGLNRLSVMIKELETVEFGDNSIVRGQRKTFAGFSTSLMT